MKIVSMCQVLGAWHIQRWQTSPLAIFGIPNTPRGVPFTHRDFF